MASSLPWGFIYQRFLNNHRPQSACEHKNVFTNVLSVQLCFSYSSIWLLIIGLICLMTTVATASLQTLEQLQNLIMWCWDLWLICIHDKNTILTFYFLCKLRMHSLAYTLNTLDPWYNWKKKVWPQTFWYISETSASRTRHTPLQQFCVHWRAVVIIFVCQTWLSHDRSVPITMRFSVNNCPFWNVFCSHFCADRIVLICLRFAVTGAYWTKRNNARVVSRWKV